MTRICISVYSVIHHSLQFMRHALPFIAIAIGVLFSSYGGEIPLSLQFDEVEKVTKTPPFWQVSAKNISSHSIQICVKGNSPETHTSFIRNSLKIRSSYLTKLYRATIINKRGEAYNRGLASADFEKHLKDYSSIQTLVLRPNESIALEDMYVGAFDSTATVILAVYKDGWKMLSVTSKIELGKGHPSIP